MLVVFISLQFVCSICLSVVFVSCVCLKCLFAVSVCLLCPSVFSVFLLGFHLDVFLSGVSVEFNFLVLFIC